MSDENETSEHTTEHEPAVFEPEPGPRRGWRDRLHELRGRDKVVGMRDAAAVGLAGLVIGGAGGFGLAAVTHDDDHRPGEMGQQWGGQVPSDHDFPGGLPDQEGHPGPPMGGLPGGGLPPGTQEDQDSYSGGSNS